jgi:hypothetical protein
MTLGSYRGFDLPARGAAAFAYIMPLRAIPELDSAQLNARAKIDSSSKATRKDTAKVGKPRQNPTNQSVLNLTPPSSGQPAAPVTNPLGKVIDFVRDNGLAVLVGVIITVLGSWVYDRIKRKVRIVTLHKADTKMIDEVHSLYVQRIEPDERVSPRYLTYCLETQSCVKSSRHFHRSVVGRNVTAVSHVLLVAMSRGDIVGLLKAVYADRARMLYIAYAAVQFGDASVERRAMRKFLQKLKELTPSHGRIRWIVFELLATDKAATGGKDRLFRHYAQSFGVTVRRVDLDYLQPDLDCAKLDECKELPAILYLGSPQGTPSQIPLPDLREIVRGILDIYLECWRLDHDPQEFAGLEAYARGLEDLIFQGAPSHIQLL